MSYPGIVHIDGHKDFSPVIQKALGLGGSREKVIFPGISGETMVTTDFEREAVLAAAGTVAEVVGTEELRHIFLVGGCGGAHPDRNHYTDFVKQTPEDILILTLACGKYRFNDLEPRSLADIPRLLDVGQYNDAFGAIQMAIVLVEALGYSVNSPPLTLILSRYEQKAVCILLSLLHSGIKNIHLDPTLPVFFSLAMLGYLMEQFETRPISTPEKDLVMILV